MDCEMCQGRGYTSIRNGDDSIDCEACGGTGEDVSDLIAYYINRYKYPFILSWILAADRMALEAARDAYWYLCGKYEATGHDRAGVAYVQYTETTGELDDLLEDDMVREDAKYGNEHYLEVR